MEKMISSNNYNSYNYRDMILKCNHLNETQQNELLNLFSRFSTLFDGTLDKFPNIKVKLILCKSAKPFCAQAYKIPHIKTDIAKKEIEELCQIGILKANVYSEWGVPCLF
jgi:hypothetical protein